MVIPSGNIYRQMYFFPAGLRVKVFGTEIGVHASKVLFVFHVVKNSKDKIIYELY